MTLTVLQARADSALVPVEVDGEDYRIYGQLVAGPTEQDATFSSLSLPHELRRLGFYAFCNDNGLRLELPPNPYAAQLGRARLVGDIVLFRTTEDGETEGLSAEDVVYLHDYLTAPPTPENRDAALEEAKWIEAYPSGLVVSFSDTDDMLNVLFPEGSDADDVTRKVP